MGKLINHPDWKVVHLNTRTILRADHNFYPEFLWLDLITKVEVEPMSEPGHYKALNGTGIPGVRHG